MEPWPTADTTAHRGIDGAIGFVQAMQRLCAPDRVVWCDGSEEEDRRLKQELVDAGVAVRLNEAKRPNSYLFRSDPRDVARSEASTFVCSEDKEDIGCLANWADPEETQTKLLWLFDGCMRGRTMYVVPFRMGPHGSPMSRVGIQVTDSSYVAISTRIMARMGKRVVDDLKGDPSLPFLPCAHSVGAPLSPGETSALWPCDPERRIVAHFPHEPSVWSFGSGYGGNALLGKKCFALRIASEMGRRDGWLAEHCLILGVRGPGMSAPRYLCAGFPSSCGKTNLAMLSPEASTLADRDDWSVTCVGDDIAWLFPRVGDDGETELRAINPEAGFFGVAPGTSWHTNPHAMRTLSRNALFTNVALTEDGDVWWEGMTEAPPAGTLTDWRGNPWTAASGTLAAHPNARYTVSASQCPIVDPEWENPAGFRVEGFLFGGRRPDTVPLARESGSWAQGVALASAIGSATTAAQDEGQQGKVRRDPFAMRPFFGYSLGGYLQHWLNLGRKLEHSAHRPRIFLVNWFQRDAQDGSFLWPGFGENLRVLRWICDRLDGRGDATPSVIGGGVLPVAGALVSEADRSAHPNSAPHVHDALLREDAGAWLREADDMERFLREEGAAGEGQAARVPEVIWREIRGIHDRAQAALSPFQEISKD